MRVRFPLVLTLLAACGLGATDSGGGGAGPSSTQLSEVMRAFTDDLESETVTLTLTLPGAPAGIDFDGACPDTSNTEDTDGDGVLDDATLTYGGSACEYEGWRGGTIAVTGEVDVTDPNLASSSGYTLQFDDLAWTYTNADESREYSATRNGRRTRLGSADSIRVESVDTTERRRTVIPAVALIAKDLLWTFGADEDDAIAIDQPLPDGKVSVEGDWHWRRSTENWELEVTTERRLQYDASCTAPQKFTNGEVRLAGRMDGVDGYITITYNDCGEEPTRTWTID